MNFALTTLIVFFFLLPGLTYRRFYYTEEFSKQYFKQSFFEVFASTFIPSIILHFIWFNAIRTFDYQIDLRVVGQLMTSRDYPTTAFENLQNNLMPIIFYHISILIFAAFSGSASKFIIRKGGFDRKKKILRFQNFWHYIFKGEFFDFPKAAFDLVDDKVDEIELLFVDALVELKEGTIIYDGVLVDYELSKEGGLQNISLKGVRRRFLKDDPQKKKKADTQIQDVLAGDLSDFTETANRYYEVPGHILIIPYEKIVNLNFSYYKIQELEKDEFNVVMVG
ncbi:MAG: hypothetical protein ACOC2M_02475 [bacterium]